MVGERRRHARRLFDGIAGTYDRPADILSLGQYARWRRVLVEEMRIVPGMHVLDVATGTGLIAADLERAGARVTGVDQSIEMIAASRARSTRDLVRADGGVLPFGDNAFDAVTFSYLLRYVDDPEAVLVELARVCAPGGMIGSVEFGVPSWTPAAIGWRAYARGIMPLAARAFGGEWAGVGSFLPRSIMQWEHEWPVDRQLDAWRRAGIEHPRCRALLFGTAVVITGRKT